MQPILLTAAEPSGDRLGGLLLAELGRRRPDLRFVGFGGDELGAHGAFESLGDSDELAAGGFVELLPRMPRLAAGRRLLRDAVDRRPPLAIFVDAPGLHLPLAERARAAGVPVAWLAVPQFWAWRGGRADRLAACADLALCLFPWEVAPLLRRGLAAVSVGHPALALAPREAHGARARPRVAVLPGSRPGEVGTQLTAMLGAARRLGDVDISVPWRLPRAAPHHDRVRFVPDPGISVLAGADVALVAAGTATLEAALLGVPQVVVAWPSPLTARLGRRLLQTPWVALPNIALGRMAVPESVGAPDEEHAAALLQVALADPGAADADARAIGAELRERLGPPGFAGRAADALAPLLPWA